MDFLGRGVFLGIVQDVQHHLALGRQTEAVLSELLQKPLLTTQRQYLLRIDANDDK
jgi:hypothetical protein